MKFKVGDKVKVVFTEKSAEENKRWKIDSAVGKIGTVASNSEGDPWPYWVEFANEDHYDEDQRLDLAELYAEDELEAAE